MKCLLLAYHFPPDPEVGGLRAHTVARTLAAAGHSVRVITASTATIPPSDSTDEAGIHVTRIRPDRGPRDLLRQLNASVRGKTDSAQLVHSPVDAGGSAAPPMAVPQWKRRLFSLIWLPDDHQGFITAALRVAGPRRIPRQDLVYVTAPPFSSLIAGQMLAGRHRARLVTEFRDPWTGNPWKPAHVRSRAADAVERALERRCLRLSALVVAVSAGIQRELARTVSGSKSPPPLVLARNGIRAIRMERGQREPGPFRVLHLGSFYFGRDPRLFIRALAREVGRQRLTEAEVQVQLVGRCRWFNGISVEDEVTNAGLEGIVRFADWVPHDEAQKLLEQADALLLLAQHQPDQVPNKLYEYLGMRVPIIAFADEDGESAQLLRQAGGHLLVTGPGEEEAAAAVNQLLALRTSLKEPVGQIDVLDRWRTASQMENLLRYLEA